jgi:small basic protein
MIPLFAVLVGPVLGLLVQPTVPLFLAPYLPVAIIAALDAIFGGTRARLDGTFSERVFLVSFLTNVMLAVFLVYLGDQLSVGDALSTAVLIVLGMRIFANLSAMRRHLFRV